MSDNITKQITTMIEIITAQSSATPIEKSVIGLLSDCRHEVDLANTKIERLREALHPLYHAASGLSFGEDWNNGTHAKLHGYRQKLIDALPAARAALGEGKE